MHPRLQRTIEKSIRQLSTLETEYYSASNLEITEEVAEKILSVWIGYLCCEKHLTDVKEHILDVVFIDDLFDPEAGIS